MLSDRASVILLAHGVRVCNTGPSRKGVCSLDVERMLVNICSGQRSSHLTVEQWMSARAVHATKVVLLPGVGCRLMCCSVYVDSYKLCSALCSNKVSAE